MKAESNIALFASIFKSFSQNPTSASLSVAGFVAPRHGRSSLRRSYATGLLRYVPTRERVRSFTSREQKTCSRKYATKGSIAAIAVEDPTLPSKQTTLVRREIVCLCTTTPLSSAHARAPRNPSDNMCRLHQWVNKTGYWSGQFIAFGIKVSAGLHSSTRQAGGTGYVVIFDGPFWELMCVKCSWLPHLFKSNFDVKKSPS